MSIIAIVFMVILLHFKQHYYPENFSKPMTY